MYNHNASFSNVTHPHSNHTAWLIGVYAATGTIAWLTVAITVVLVYGHLRYWIVPDQQTLIIRLLLMVPIYSVDSWLSVQFHDYALYFNLVRDCYESYALYCFFSLLSRYVESEDEEQRSVEDILQDEPVHKHMVPLCFLKPVKPGALFMIWIKRFILQYTLIKPACTLLACVLYPFHLYAEGSFSLKTGYLYIVVITNISVGISLYCLVLFYQVAYPFLKPYKPLLKFLSIKAVIFFSFWQSVIIAILNHYHIIPPFGTWEASEVGGGLNNILICIEMFVLSILNYFIFPYKTYKPVVKRTPRKAGEVLSSAFQNFARDVVDQSDVVYDVKNAFGKKGYYQAVEKHHK
eukprot:TRINITY_DN9858_c0_g1_i3.p1 TRINITY_DN9858_c0_g1~~TRINITY_DN9858_c0_g1_i3.p1  ORF type:complete len:349 (-),score=43.55 TRINITY_DN9858_c0_g1_i3:125-1171(-)